MNHRATIPLLLVSAIALTACGRTDRRMIITSEPQGARVFLNDTDVGVTPTEVDFTWFGTYDVRLNKPGYEPVITKREAKAPLHELPGIDLVAMALPTDKSTIIEWHFDLEPASTDAQALLDRAIDLQAQTLAQPSENANEAPAPEDADASPPSPSEESN